MTESQYDYSKLSDHEKSFLPEGFQGNIYNLSYKWTNIIPVKNEKLRILEIGAYHGANVCSYMKTYAQHPDSEVHCVDPWFDYDEYSEYKNIQYKNYSRFLTNITKLNPSDIQKIYIHRGLSGDIVPRFENEYFDIIYIDGNHEKKFVLEDAVISFNKVKKGGWIVFDDLHDSEVAEAIKAFLVINIKYFTCFDIQHSQLIIQKKA